MNWIEIGQQLRASAMAAHGFAVSFESALQFLLDSPECFGVEEWPDVIPVDEIALGYRA